MKEAEWLASSDPVKMLDWLKARKIRARKLRLFAAACVRRLWPWLADERSKAALVALEVFADGLGKQADKEPLSVAWEGARAARDADQGMSPTALATRAACSASEPTDAHWAARWGMSIALDAAKAWGREGEPAVVAGLLRDVVGDPRAKAAFDASLRTSGILTMARAAYEARDGESGQLEAARLLVLSDGLEEAGCADAELLGHLRSPGPHVRGCWALDVVLAKV